MKALRDADVLSPVGVVKLEVSSEEISDAVSAAAETLPPDMAELLCARMPQVIAAVRRARYINLYQLLGDNLEVAPVVNAPCTDNARSVLAKAEKCVLCVVSVAGALVPSDSPKPSAR